MLISFQLNFGNRKHNEKPSNHINYIKSTYTIYIE